MTKMNHAGKVILFLALTVVLALICVGASADDVILEHQWNSGQYLKAATCSHGEIWRYTCILPGCGATQDVEVTPTNPNAHEWGEWITDLAPTCTTPGKHHRQCKLVSHHQQSEEMPALGHSYDNGVVKKKPTCTEPGQMVYTCIRCGHSYDGPIAATGHDWGPWEDVTAATCITGGRQKSVCKNDASHVQYRDVAPTGHQWGPWTVITPATCTTTGLRRHICAKCGLTEEEVIPATGHKWDKGVVTKQPTLTEEGEKKYTCQNDPSHVKYEKLGRKTIVGTLCAFGFRLRESNLYPYSSDKWYMYTPFDASKDGSQNFEVVLADAYIPGTITITVRDGYLTVHQPAILGNSLVYDLKFFTVLNKITDLTMFEPEQLMHLNMQFDTPYDMDEMFGEDRNLVLYLCCRVSATFDQRWEFLQYNSAVHQRILDSMRQLMQSDML